MKSKRAESAHYDIRVEPATALPRWMRIREIADDLDVSSSTAYKWSARGSPFFPKSIRLPNGDIRIRRDWYEAWLANLEAGP